MLTNPARGPWLRRFFWTHPEWWSLLLVALAWAVVVAHAGGHQGHVPERMSGHELMSAQPALPTQGAVVDPLELLDWSLMVMAMMIPLMLEPLRWVAFQSFRQRRHRAILLFLVGYLLPWMLPGVVAVGLRSLAWGRSPLLAAGLFGLAALWALVPVRKQALVFCHLRIPLTPSGWQADRDCLRFSLILGASCVGACGFLMLACAATGHNLIAMLGGTALAGLEFRSFRPPTRPIVVGALILAVWFLLPVRLLA